MVDDAPGPVGLTDIAKRAGLIASKARNGLVSLLRTDPVQHDTATGRCDLGAGALRLGLTAFGRIGGNLLPGITRLAVPIRDHEGRVRTLQNAVERRIGG